MIPVLRFLAVLASPALAASAWAATVVPNFIQMPGTQPGEVMDLDASTCQQCHGGFNDDHEPWHTWRGSMMAHAGEDPLWWATLAIAEQDIDGSGDLCIRCHMPKAWIGGRSTPTDASDVTTSDVSYGVQCDLCHRLTNPDQSEWIGVQNAPFIAKTGSEGHFGAGQYVLGFDTTRYGPYADSAPPHPNRYSQFHRSPDLCGTCHDVSNPATGDLAPMHGAQQPLDPGTYADNPNAPVAGMAAFNNPPYRYGVVERTYSEHMASAFPSTRVQDINSLPAELRDGSIYAAWEAASSNGGSGTDYADGTTRYFTCQTCHMKPTTGRASWIGGLYRTDLAVHDLTGGNYWAPEAIMYMKAQGNLSKNAGLSGDNDALSDGIARAKQNLEQAAKLEVNGNTLRVINLTGHKLISGYPEGRRMWLNVKWYDSGNNLLREDGAYGTLNVNIDGQQYQVESLLDPYDPDLRLYWVEGGISQAWAAKLINAYGKPGSTPVEFDRYTGAVTTTLADVANQSPGTAHHSFHFVLNDTVMADTRIPPYRMRYDDAQERNTLPVPETQYGNPGPGGEYDYWDEVALNPPAGATSAQISLMYQPTSWEYIQFLYEANTGQIGSLSAKGADLLDAWLNTGMAEPYVMTTATWGNGAPPPEPETVTVPNVVGQSQSAATNTIAAAGLTVGSVTQQWTWSWWDNGNVIDQNPSAGNELEAGSAVDLTIAQ